MWREPKPGDPALAFAPGQFFYKSSGLWCAFELEDSGELDFNKNPIMKPSLPANEHLTKDGETVHPLRLAEVDQYMLGAYGKLRSKGKDVLGEEGSSTSYPPDPYPPFTRLYIPHWTRSQYSNTEKSGSPYSGDLGTDDSIRYGCPNAIPDGIILVLTAGEEYVGD